MFAFIEHSAEVFPDYAERKKLHASDEEYGHHYCRVTGYRVPMQQAVDEKVHQIDETNQGAEDSKYGCDAEWGSGVGCKAVESQVHKAPEMPFGCAVGAFELFIFYPFFTESNPAIHPFGVALCFAHVAQRVDAYAVEEPEIAQIGRASCRERV